MTNTTTSPATTRDRYVQQGRDVIDGEGNRRASFVSEASARESAEWMNGGTARIDNYVWSPLPASEREVSALDRHWTDEQAAEWLADHPEVSDVIPGWIDEVEFVEVADGCVRYRLSRSVGELEIVSLVERSDAGAVTVEPPLLHMDARHIEGDDLTDAARGLARDLDAVAALLDGDAR